MADGPTVLSPELASAMLDVVRRRNRYPRGTQFVSTVLESALHGAPDFAPELPNFVRVRKAEQDSPPVLHWKHS